MKVVYKKKNSNKTKGIHRHSRSFFFVSIFINHLQTTKTFQHHKQLLRITGHFHVWHGTSASWQVLPGHETRKWVWLVKCGVGGWRVFPGSWGGRAGAGRPGYWSFFSVSVVSSGEVSSVSGGVSSYLLPGERRLQISKAVMDNT